MRSRIRWRPWAFSRSARDARYHQAIHTMWRRRSEAAMHQMRSRRRVLAVACLLATGSPMTGAVAVGSSSPPVAPPGGEPIGPDQPLPPPPPPPAGPETVTPAQPVAPDQSGQSLPEEDERIGPDQPIVSSPTARPQAAAPNRCNLYGFRSRAGGIRNGASRGDRLYISHPCIPRRVSRNPVNRGYMDAAGHVLSQQRISGCALSRGPRHEVVSAGAQVSNLRR